MEAVEEIVKIGEKGQIILPEKIREKDWLKKEKRENGCERDRKEIRREKSIHEKYIILEK